MKQQLILNFENWYAEEFEAGQGGGSAHFDETYNQTMKQHMHHQISTYKGDSLIMGIPEDEVDDDAMAFIRAKKKVDTLHKAKKMEKSRPGRA